MVPVKELSAGFHYVQATVYFEDCMSVKSDWFEKIGDGKIPTPTAIPARDKLEDPSEIVPPDPLALDSDGLGGRDDESGKDAALNSERTPTPGLPGKIRVIPSTGPWGILILVIFIGLFLSRIRRIG